MEVQIKEEVLLDTSIVKEEYIVQELDEAENQNIGNASSRWGNMAERNKGKIQCPECPKSFRTKSKLKAHSVVHSTKPLPCEICGKSISNPAVLMKLHMRKHSAIKVTYDCDKCGKKLTCKHNLKLHIQKIHLRPKFYKCDLCGVQFRIKYYFDKHMLGHDMNLPPAWLRQCSVCNKLVSRSSFTEHMACHKTNRTDVCKICNAAFKSKNRLQHHLTLVHMDKGLDCLYCSQKFRNYVTLRSHIDASHIGLPHSIQDDGPVRCTICLKSFENIESLKEHVKIYLNEKPFVCALCDRRFTSRTTIRSHIRYTHLKKRSKKDQLCILTCPACGLTIQGRVPFHQHKLHCKAKPFKCNLCSRTYASANSLESHWIVHREDRPVFQCKVCAAKFMTKPGLNTHTVLKHSVIPKETRLDCPHCPLAFENKVTLERHMANYHNVHFVDLCDSD